MWTSGQSPAPGISPQFSARWAGQIEAVYSETYSFVTTSDDGVRVWVDGVEVIDDWTDHVKTTDTGTIALSAGQLYDVVVEYYNGSESGTVDLQWASPSTPLEVVPAAFLFPYPVTGADAAE